MATLIDIALQSGDREWLEHLVSKEFEEELERNSKFDFFEHEYKGLSSEELDDELDFFIGFSEEGDTFSSYIE